MRIYSPENKRHRLTSKRHHHKLGKQRDSHPAHYPSRALKEIGVTDFVVNGKYSLLQIHHPHVTTVVAETTAQGTHAPAKEIHAVQKAKEIDVLNIDALMREDGEGEDDAPNLYAPAVDDEIFSYEDLYSICTKKSKLIIHYVFFREPQSPVHAPDKSTENHTRNC